MSTVHKNFKDGGFNRFKRKLRRSALIKGMILGLSCGIFAAAGIILYQKVNTVIPDPLLYVSVGFGVALVIGVISFLLLRPSEKAIAKKLDKDLKLGEKVQTMLAYRGEDSDMLALQREDTDERLLQTPTRAVRYRHSWKHAFAPVLACALLTVAVMTPVKAVELPPEEHEPPFELTTWQETALLELIEEVKASNMETAPKNATVHELEVLLAALRVTDTESDMKIMVITVIANLNTIVREYNSANVFSLYMTASEHEHISGMAMAMDMLSGLEVREAVASGRESLRVDDVAEPLDAYTAALDSVLLGAEEKHVPENDEMLKALSDFSAALTDVLAQVEDYTREWIQDRLDTVFDSAADALSDAMLLQYTNLDVKDTVVLRLMEIFGISEDELPEEEKEQLPTEGDHPEDENKDEEEKNNQGGIGNMEILYGSDDQIFDPVNNQYVKYGDVINEYFAAVSEKIIDGQIPDTLEQFISNYFETLYDGSEKETAQ